ncbi:MAG: glutamine--tRNA ligase/YqeY domain fusion protein [Clostridia bacterium]|nr:glutamine--tRNA ligase/YqeY domain fusion protein [Clostridia bacterium]
MEATNFIEEIINKDLESGKYDEIITRFPPEPNGYLHVGHAKALCVNFGIKQKYNGKCNLRFDDTNPTKEDTEYVEAIKEDIKWLGFTWDEELYASDYYEKMYDCAVILIKKGLAYVDNLTAEEIRLTRGTLTEGGKESPNRNRPIEESLDLFQRMRNGEFADGELVLRAKIDMNSPNINMRDPVIYRIVRAHHMRQKNKWCIYPMYDFAHPLEDAFEGITHSCCTLEFEDHRPLYDWVVDNCDIEKKPHQYEFARLNITRCIMSKRYLKSLVDNNKVDGWDDPRMPTICGLRRRGYTPESIKDFCERIGVAKANSELDIKNLEACIREDLNQRANRVMAVLRPIKLTLKNYEGVEELEVENNPSDETAGTRKITFSKDLYIDADDFALVPPPKWKRLSPGGMVRLKGAYVITCDEVVEENGEIKELICSYIPESKSGMAGSDDKRFKKVGTIQFVDANNCYKFKARKYDYLLKEAEYPGQNFNELINENTIEEFDAVGEKSLESAPYGSRFQFIRVGYFIKDEKSNTFGQIVSLKDGFKK